MAAACCATCGSRFFRWCFRILRHTGMSPGYCTHRVGNRPQQECKQDQWAPLHGIH
jgi:hypothetical protein